MKAIPYHSGEIAVQERAGSRPMALQLASILLTEIPAQARAFLSAQPLLVVGSADEGGRLWASVLTGPPGFLQAPDPHTLHIHALPGDVLADNLAREAAIGTTAVDFASRRRIRLNGRAHRTDYGIAMALDEVFFNCPKYIQARVWEAPPTPAPPAPAAVAADVTTDEIQQWITQADTFFLASAHARAGLDVSHRGGLPGFVHMPDAHTLQWPDYAGNGMFQTLGNLTLDPRAGLLFPDFSSGRVLQLTGRTSIDWNPAQVSLFPGAERVVTFHAEQACVVKHALPFPWVFRSHSPYNPPVSTLGASYS